jgi:hypothetical protein
MEIDSKNAETLLARTWEALQIFELDPADKESVLKYEKLVKLHLSLQRYLDKNPAPVEFRELSL